MVASTDRLFRPLVLSALYACFLPWCVGRVLGDRLAVVFVWGVLLLDGGPAELLSPDMAFIVGALWHLTVNLPFLVVLSNAVGRALRGEREKISAAVAAKRNLLLRILSFCWRHLGAGFIFTMLAHNCVVLWWMYGLVSVLSPWGLGRLVLALVLYRRACNLRRRDFEALGVDV